MKKITLALALLASCSPDSPSNPPTPPDSSQADPAVPPRPAGKVIGFTAPSGWIKEEPSNNMRKAQYRVPDRQKQAKDATFTLSTTRIWGPDSFDENLGRWVAQMGGAKAKVEKFDGKHKVTLVDLSGDYRSDFEPEPIPNARMLLGLVEPGDQPWFFKIVGPIETVGGWRDEFVTMLKGAAN